MLCEMCKQNEATVFYQQIINDTQTEFHLCEECAHKKGVLMMNQISTTNLLGGLVEPGTITPQEVELRCKNCGLNYPNFCERGKFGCSECYQAFSQKLSSIFRKIHGSTQHTGKRPIALAVSLPAVSPKPETKIEQKTGDEIALLRQELQVAIKTEEFEKAAELRDRIKAME
ncbi:UvrB/UvrC motif-containing protein [bacterium]|nr:UvrB/UvrC motif-containing protein [bacterium]MBU1754224.1 UvrB/UvrC motif-containing protein [bacterium]